MKSRFSASKRLLGIVVLVAAGIAVWGGMQVLAADSPASSSVANPGVKKAAVVVPGGVSRLVRTYHNTGFNGITTPGGSYPSNMVDVDTGTTIHCPATGPHGRCLLVINPNAQIGDGAADNRVFYIPEVDGTEISNGPYVGLAGLSGRWNSFTWQDVVIITPGNHTVVTKLGTDTPALLANYAVEYRVFQH